jgi:hypothetical protein
MVDFNRINPAVLRQAEALAAERNQTLDVLIEEALRSYLNRRPVGIVGGGTVALPIARHLARPKVDLSQSLGKLLDVDDDGLPVDKLR